MYSFRVPVYPDLWDKWDTLDTLSHAHSSLIFHDIISYKNGWWDTREKVSTPMVWAFE
jgi:hypothetical protein